MPPRFKSEVWGDNQLTATDRHRMYDWLGTVQEFSHPATPTVNDVSMKLTRPVFTPRYAHKMKMYRSAMLKRQRETAQALKFVEALQEEEEE